MTAPAASSRPGRRGGRARLAAGLAAVLLATAATVTGCAAFSATAPGCNQPLRLAIVAQSLPSASYLPCIRTLPPGWSTSGFRAAPGGTSFLLNSDRSPGRPVRVRLSATCRPGEASPSPPRAPGAVTYTRLASIIPRFAGSLYDVFLGGCVSYSFDFALGSQIALMEQFEQAVGLYPRQQLRLVLKRELGVAAGP
jgi:hypothetical protein